MKALCIKIPKEKGESVRKQLLELGVLRKDLKIKGADFLYIPVSEKVDIGYDVMELDFDTVKKEIRDYKEIADVPEELRCFLPKSFDIIGDICVLKLPAELMDYKKDIGSALLKTIKNLRAVCIDKGVKEKLRVRDIEIVAGERKTETVHAEHGIKLKTDIAKVYFSPRLATEHYRVAKQVKEGEVIIDMFAGVGGFSIMIAKHRKPQKIYAVDLNPNAVSFLNENIKLNHVENIFPICGDAKKILSEFEKADRVIMNLPMNAFEFFEVAVQSLKNQGMLHYYEIIERGKISERISELEKICREYNYKMEVANLKVVRSYSATEVHVGLDLTLKIHK